MVVGEVIKLYKQVFLWHTALVKDGLMISWWHNMVNTLKRVKQETISKINWTLDQWKKDREDLFGW